MGLGMTAVTGFGEHAGHKVHPHDHSGQGSKRLREGVWCSGRWLCQSCTDRDLYPRGTWFGGPECPRPKPVPSANGTRPKSGSEEG
jgi:hypothetical protein